MKILMLGWEFPPVYSGGLGVVSKHLALELAKKNVDIHFALPHYIRRNIPDQDVPQEFSLINCDEATEAMLQKIQFHRIPSMLASPYQSAESYQTNKANTWNQHKKDPSTQSQDRRKKVYGEDLFQEIERFAVQMELFAEGKHFDLIHAHDWITFEAGLRLRKKLKIPLVLHIHATEIDRTGGNPNPSIFQKEKEGLHQADKIIAVSHYTKQILIDHYEINPDKIEAIHNAHRQTHRGHRSLPDYLKKNNSHEKIILFIGRVTLQKGPDYFLKVAEKVLVKEKNIKFLLVGTGDMLSKLMHEIAEKRLQNQILCLGFLDGEEKRLAYEKADLCIMPSVSEPFGLTALEAAECGTPLILSKKYGATEVLFNALKTECWDVEKMAEYVLATVKYPVLNQVLACKTYEDMEHLTWENQALKVKAVYEEAMG